eukprot:gene1906-3687_t
MSQMLSEKRKVRGQNMGALIGEALAQGDQFWNNDSWKEEEESDDDSFRDDNVKPDVFDSDFNDTEDEMEDGSDDETSKKTKTKPTEKSKSKNKYVEPTTHKKKSVPKGIKKRPVIDNVNTSQDSSQEDPNLISSDSLPRFVRASTKLKTLDADARLAESRVASAKFKQRIIPQVKHQFTQKELLQDALNTEIVNAKWLQNQKLAEEERAASSKPARVQQGNVTRTLSRRGMYTTITFTEVESWPKIFEELPPPKYPVKVCTITGLPARYMDPLTGLPYANLEAFRIIRKKHYSSSTVRNKATTT